MAPRATWRDVVPLDAGWQAAPAPVGEHPAPAALDALDWLPARVPGTAADVLRRAGLPARDLDADEWWYRLSFEAHAPTEHEQLVLCLGGLATLADVFLNGRLVLSSGSMFAAHEIDIGSAVAGRNELAIRFRPIRPELARRRRPRARWRTRLVADNNLRWLRTMLLGRIPSFSPGPAAVGPWRAVWLERRRGLAIDELDLRPRLDGDDGVLAVNVRFRSLGEAIPKPLVLEVDGPSGHHRLTLETAPDEDAVTARGELRIPAVARWWPHNHGSPTLHEVRLLAGADPTMTIDARRIGFRSVAGGPPGHDVERDGLALHVNGQPVFARGGLWTPLDITSLDASVDELRAALEDIRAAGMNMVRLPGFGPYEQPAFHDLCDELGIMVWQDLAFASLDYPFEDPDFLSAAQTEVRAVLAHLAGRPSTTVVCGNSEVEQQVAMLGLDPQLARIPFYDSALPELAAAARLDAVVIPSAPYGGDLPMRADRGVTNYYSIGGYRAPLSDARTSGLVFAAESLGFGNIPNDAALAAFAPEGPSEAYTHDPRWKAGVPRDAGAGWDFDDVRDHYLGVVFGADPNSLRRDNWLRYLELSRAVTGEVMASAYGEWRRAASPCNGALILWLRDLVPGAGYGIFDNLGLPKTPYYYLKRVLAPTAVWLVDEGTGGVIAHVANDGPEDLRAALDIRLYTDQELLVAQGHEALRVPAQGSLHRDIEAVIGHFVDAAWAYRFGPPAHDTIVATLTISGPAETLISQAFHFPAGRPMSVEPERRMGLSATAQDAGDGTHRVTLASRRLAYCVRVHAPGFEPSDDAFSIEPGGSRTIVLTPRADGASFSGGWLTALNLAGRTAIRGTTATG